MTVLLSPTTGKPLRKDGPGVLTDGTERWPVLAGIPYLRTGRRELRDAALAAIDRGDERGALALLLRDQDDWHASRRRRSTRLPVSRTRSTDLPCVRRWSG